MICPFCLAVCTVAFTKTVMGRYQAHYGECPSCGSLHVIAPYWLVEAYADPGAADKLDSAAEWRNINIARAVLAIAKSHPLPAAPWLDFGCGQGRLGQILHAHGRQIQGFDPLRDATAEQPHSYTYGLVTSFEVLEHTQHPRVFLAMLLGLLVQGNDPAPLLVLSTCLRRREHGPEWSYLATRSGQHIAFASEAGMRYAVGAAGAVWWCTGVLRENAELQVHVIGREAPDGEALARIATALNDAGYTCVVRVPF